MTATLPVSYTSVPLIYTTLGEIGSRTTMTSAQILSHAGQVEATINAKIAKQYTLPFSGVVPLLQSAATDLTIYRLLSKVIFTSEKLKDSPWPARYKEAMDLIEGVAGGSIPLLNSAHAIIGARTDVAEVWSTTKDFNPTFTEDAPSLQIIDEDKIDQIRGDRNIG